VDTPGLASGLPAFARLGPLLRTPVQGADTVVWLAAGEARHDPALPLTEGFFHDRHRRGEHHLPWTACGATPADGRLLWEWCGSRTDATGVPSARPDPRPPSDVAP
jgi:dehydrogenase/reductase SDR family member 12